MTSSKSLGLNQEDSLEADLEPLLKEGVNE
ncbi:DUF1473 family protein [Borreliella valaisiana]